MVVLPMPTMPQIPTNRTSSDPIHNSESRSSIRESIPTRASTLLENASIGSFKILVTISSITSDSSLQISNWEKSHGHFLSQKGTKKNEINIYSSTLLCSLWLKKEGKLYVSWQDEAKIDQIIVNPIFMLLWREHIAANKRRDMGVGILLVSLAPEHGKNSFSFWSFVKSLLFLNKWHCLITSPYTKLQPQVLPQRILNYI